MVQKQQFGILGQQTVPPLVVDVPHLRKHPLKKYRKAVMTRYDTSLIGRVTDRLIGKIRPVILPGRIKKILIRCIPNHNYIRKVPFNL